MQPERPAPSSAGDTVGPDDRLWAEQGRSLNRRIVDLQWQLGDWAQRKPASRTISAASALVGCSVSALRKPDGMVDEVAAARAGVSLQQLRFCRWLSKKFPPDRRRSISHTHHAAVAALPDDVADQMLDQAVEERWNVTRIRAEAQLAAAEAEVERARAEAARARAAASGAWRADSRRAVRECRERLTRAAVNIRAAEDIVAELATHPGIGQVHGNAIAGVIERLRAVFDPVAHMAGAWAAQVNRFARLRRAGPRTSTA